MSRPQIEGATGGGPGTLPCGWLDKCQGHQKAVDGYVPDRANLGRMPLDKYGWLRPWEMGLPENTTKITDVHTGKKWSGQVTATNYRYQRHHIIPCEVFKNPILNKNLELLGYDINVFDENGISLPYRIKDLVWHDLQFHRGSHPAYTGIVRTRVMAIVRKCGQYCEKGEQSTLWDFIKERVDKSRNEIKNWTLLIHPWAAAERPIQFSIWT